MLPMQAPRCVAVHAATGQKIQAKDVILAYYDAYNKGEHQFLVPGTIQEVVCATR
jgi:hypothetical protein